MSTAEKTASIDKTERISPRARILAAASDLFYRHGIRAVDLSEGDGERALAAIEAAGARLV